MCFNKLITKVREERRKGVFSMKLLTKKPVVITTPVEEEKPKRKSHTQNTLPPDTYRDEIEPKRINIDEGIDLVFSVKRGGENGLPRVDIRQYVKTENYEGFTKKGVNFSLEYLYDIIDILNDVNEECSAKGLDEEFQD